MTLLVAAAVVISTLALSSLLVLALALANAAAGPEISPEDLRRDDPTF